MKMANIEAERSRLGLTKTALSEKLGISIETYRKYVNGNPIPSDKLLVMKELFGCTVDYLLADTNKSA